MCENDSILLFEMNVKAVFICFDVLLQVREHSGNLERLQKENNELKQKLEEVC